MKKAMFVLVFIVFLIFTGSYILIELYQEVNLLHCFAFLLWLSVEVMFFIWIFLEGLQARYEKNKEKDGLEWLIKSVRKTTM